jgi:hypothetical protein
MKQGNRREIGERGQGQGERGRQRERERGRKRESERERAHTPMGSQVQYITLIRP